MHGIYLGSIMYADDLLLMSASITDLHLQIDTCAFEGRNLGITFNSKKCKSIAIGPTCNLFLADLSINNLPLE